MEKTADITIVLDKSGSMQTIKKETIQGFNSFISNQLKNKINARITLVQFDHEYQLLYEAVKLEYANELSDDTYRPRGWTALLDAIGKTIKLSKERYKHLKKAERPDKTMFIIITDGEENSSINYTRDMIFKKIKKMEGKHSWEFIFLGANQDAISEAQNYGIKARRAMSFAASSVCTTAALESVSDNICSSINNNEEFEFTDEDREKQKR